MKRNIWYDLCDDEPALPIAPVRVIPITPEVLAEDARKQAERRQVRITWTPRLSEQKSKPDRAKERSEEATPSRAHSPARIPRKPAQTQPCKKCGAPALIRKNKKGFCPTCKPERRKRKKHAIPYHDWRKHGLCIRCGDAPEAGKMQCKRCRERQSENSARYYQNKKKREEKA
jgi:hypothetical protein